MGSQSSLFNVEDAPGSGRGAFAAQDLPKGTTIHIADDLTAHVLLREYRGEVCWACFAYDRGRKLKFRDVVCGFSFCSEKCETSWRRTHDGVCSEAWADVEKLLKSSAKANEPDSDKEHMQGGHSRPSAADIKLSWIMAEERAASIWKARSGTPGTVKEHRKALQHALAAKPSADIITFQLHAVLARYRTPEQWPAILDLAEEPCPYTDAQELESHISSYLQLIAVLPEQLLPIVTPETLLTVKTREVHNSFGIRSLEDDGDEFFGYGVWPSASYFNHSCSPNVRKERIGAAWVFEAQWDISAGDELHISYLGGEEETLSKEERSARLKKVWGFNCACPRCV